MNIFPLLPPGPANEVETCCLPAPGGNERNGDVLVRLSFQMMSMSEKKKKVWSILTFMPPAVFTPKLGDDEVRVTEDESMKRSMMDMFVRRGSTTVRFYTGCWTTDMFDIKRRHTYYTNTRITNCLHLLQILHPNISMQPDI